MGSFARVTASAIFAVWVGIAAAFAEQEVRLRSGLILRGSVLEIASLNQNAYSAAGGGGEIKLRPIWMIDDGLRRTYVHKLGMVAEVNPVEDLSQKMEFWQPAPLGGRGVAGLGAILEVSPFNNYGRRVITVRGPDSTPLSIIQGITEINARYAKVEGLKSTPSYVWDMRVATSSIPPEELREIFRRRVDQEDLDQRLEVVRFYIEAEQFAEARDELQRAIDDFPDQQSMITQLRALVQRQGTQLLAEARFRRDAGQYALATAILENFPLTEVARVTALEVQDSIASIQGKVGEGQRLLDQLSKQIETLPEGYEREPLRELVREMSAALSLDTLARLSDYSRLGGVDTIPLDNRVALAIGGWLLGAGSGLQNLQIATALIEIRGLVGRYLASEEEAERQSILDELRAIEGAEPNYVAMMLPLMEPPKALPDEAADPEVPGLYRVTQTLTGAAHGEYAVQLPPEYNPLRSYPCIVSLHPLGGPAEGQLDYWAGRFDRSSGSRLGQATRHGFVVIAPVWSRMGQRRYESTPREHAQVLSALRDAMRRVSIDSDRVFLAGMGEGGSAAWDIALSHPDPWAGMISIGGEPSNYVRHYHPNGTAVPMYLVFGELAGAPAPLMRYGDVLDGYMKPSYHTLVVMYRGRGSEPFYEEIHHIFDWMRLATLRRGEPPRQIETVTMRQGDQFFWWLELPELLPNVAIDPFLWDQAARLRAAKVSASIGEGNTIRIGQGPSDRFIVHLSPEMGIDLNQTVTIRYRSRKVDVNFDGRLDYLLEDARSRADRKRPHWTMTTVP